MWKCKECNHVWNGGKYASLKRKCPKCGANFPVRCDPQEEFLESRNEPFEVEGESIKFGVFGKISLKDFFCRITKKSESNWKTEIVSPYETRLMPSSESINEVLAKIQVVFGMRR